MFERFTNRARAAVVHAQEEARGLGHNYIGTEHVLLGLLGEPEGIAGLALRRLGVTLERTRTEVAALIGRSDDVPSGHIPFTPRAKKVLELALREALSMGHNYIGTEHIALGIVAEGDGVAMQVIVAQGATGERVRQEVLAELGKVVGARVGAPSRVPNRTPAAEAVIVAAQELAGEAPMGSHHLLEAMALLDNSLGGATLAALGIAPDALAAKIDELGLDGTTDVTPELAAVQRLEIHLDDESVRIVLGDEATHELVAKLVESMGNPIRGSDPAGTSLIGLWQATLTALQELVRRLEPDEPADDSGRAAVVRAAIRNRLRRRRPGPS
jgi:ATP-dependent Clp protease ATP-binding subunit ClpC